MWISCLLMRVLLVSEVVVVDVVLLLLGCVWWAWAWEGREGGF